MNQTDLPAPVDPVYSLPDAIRVTRGDIWRSVVNVADGQPPKPAPWRPGMRLRGATLYVHPARSRLVRAWLD